MWNALFITRFLDACGGDIAPTDDRADAFVAMTKPPADCAWAFPISLGDYNLSLWQWVAWLCVPVGKSECFASSFCAAGTRPDTGTSTSVIFKNVTNVIQLVAASMDITAIDCEKRANARAKKTRSRSPSR